MENVSIATAVSDIWTMAGDALDFITGNGIMNTIFCASLIPVAFMVIRRAKKSAY